ncbi:MAG: ATP-binding cassette domain-containing protein [Culicoidibacterales bacterium]
MLSVHHLNKTYYFGKSEEQVLKDVSLNFPSGKAMALLGPSGSGKSTLLNIIGGLDNQYEGEVCLFGQCLNRKDMRYYDSYRLNQIGFVFQAFYLLEQQTVYENIRLGLLPLKLSAQETQQRIEQVLEEVGLAEFAQVKANLLSGGQKQRVAIARALVKNPTIIIADEPTGALDSETAAQILALLLSFKQSGKIVIIVTHDEEIAAACDHIARIQDGQILQSPPDDQVTKQLVWKKPQFSWGRSLVLMWRNLWQRKTRNGVMSGFASIGIVALILTTSLGVGAQLYLEKQVDREFNPKEVVITTSDRSQPIDPAFIATLQADATIDRVETAYPIILTQVRYESSVAGGSPTISVPELTPNQSERMNVINGQLPSETALEIALQEDYATKLAATPSDLIGKTVTLVASGYAENAQPMTLEATVTGIFGEPKDENGRTFDSGPRSANGVNYVTSLALNQAVIEASTGNAVENLEFRAYTLEIDTASAIAAQARDEGYRAVAVADVLGTINQLFDGVRIVLTSVGFISVFVAGMMIGIVMYISVIERTTEIGLMRALGYRRFDIGRIFLGESVVIGLITGVAGCVVAYAMSFGLNVGFYDLIGFNIVEIPLSSFAAALSIAVIMGLLGGIIPATIAARKDPVVALRTE